MTSQIQLISSWKTLFQLAGTTFRYSGPKCSSEHLGKGLLMAKPPAGVSRGKRRGRFCLSKSLTEAKVSQLEHLALGLLELGDFPYDSPSRRSTLVTLKWLIQNTRWGSLCTALTCYDIFQYTYFLILFLVLGIEPGALFMLCTCCH